MKALLTLLIVAFFSLNSSAQEASKEELKAQREVMRSESKSEAYVKRQLSIAELEAPKTTEVQSIDAFASTSTSMLLNVKNNNEIIPELYKRTVGETIDGVTDITVKKPTLQELTAIATNIIEMTSSVTLATAQVPSIVSDLKSLNPLKAGKAVKSVNYSKNVLSLLAPELIYQSKMVSNLISTLKSSENL